MTGRRGWLIGLLAALTSLSCADRDETNRPDDWDGPWLAIDSASHDFGELYAGQLRRHEFKLTNRGRQPLVIKDAKKECGCTDPIFDRREIPPGASSTMTVEFKPPFAGDIVKRIWLYTNDPYARETIFSIRSKGLGPARLIPSVIELDDDLPDEGLTRELRIELPDDREIVRVEFNSTSPWMTVAPKGAPSGSSAAFVFSLRGVREALRIREQIPVFITSRDALGKVVTFGLPFSLQVTGEVRPVAIASPPVVHFGAMRIGESRERRLDLEIAEPTATRPKVESSGIDGLIVEPVDGSPNRYRVRLRPDAKRTIGRLMGSVTFRYGSGRTIVVPIHGWLMA